MSSHSNEISSKQSLEGLVKKDGTKSSAFFGLILSTGLFAVIIYSTYITFTKPEYEGRRVIYYICYGIICVTCILPILIEKIWKTVAGKTFFILISIVGVLFFGGWSAWSIYSMMSTAPPWVIGLLLIYLIFK